MSGRSHGYPRNDAQCRLDDDQILSSIMSDDAKIYVDASRPATLHNGAISTDWPTLRDAIKAWHRLRPEQARAATIRVIDKAVEIAALGFEPHQ
jgi:hypothetical protein